MILINKLPENKDTIIFFQAAIFIKKNYDCMIA
jgi:hypothetical protein